MTPSGSRAELVSSPLVPTLGVGTHVPTLRVAHPPRRDAERPRRAFPRRAWERGQAYLGLTLQPTPLWVHSRQRRRTVAQSALQLEVTGDGIGILTFDQP